jgi:predicted CoA-binding protein
MTTEQAVNKFLRNKSIAVVGVSRDKKKFGYAAYKGLKDKSYNVFPVNPNIDRIDSEKCYANLSSIKEKPEGVLLVVQPKQSEAVVKEAADLGIKSIWFHQGSSSDAAIKFCKERGMSVVSGECILMFAEPVDSIHKFHRWIWKIFRKLPA